MAPDPDSASDPPPRWTAQEVIRSLRGVGGIADELLGSLEESVGETCQNASHYTSADFASACDEHGNLPYKGALPTIYLGRSRRRPDAPTQPENSYVVTEAEAKELIKVHANAIFSARDDIRQILKSREALLRKKWNKKTKEQKAKILRVAWPEIPTRHRPDIHAALEAFSTTNSSPATPTRDDSVYKWPHLNIEDLVESQNFLLLINSRAHNNPDVFAHADREACRIGLATHKIKTAWLPRYLMVFIGQDSPETYGAMVHGDVDDQAFLLFVGGVHFHSDMGLLVLEVQRKIYEGLLRCCFHIFSDISRDELFADAVPEVLGLDNIETSNTTYTELASAVTQAPYRVPASLDTHRLLQWIEAKRDAAEDHAWSLREDPGYFKEVMLERAIHRYEHLPDANGKKSPSLDSECFWNNVIAAELDSTFKLLLTWNLLSERAKTLNTKAPNGLGCFDHRRPLPEDVETIILEMMLHFKCLALCYKASLSDAACVSPQMGISCVRKELADGMSMVALRGPFPSKDQLFNLFHSAFSAEETAINKLGLHNVVDEIQKIIKQNPKEMRRFSPYAWEQYSGMAFTGNLSRVLEGLHPWGSTFEPKLPSDEQISSVPQISLFTDIRAIFEKEKLYPAGASEPRLPLPIKDSLAYPIDKSYNERNVEILRRSEWNLDSFWRKLDSHFYINMGHTLNDVLCRYSKGRSVIHRTLPFRPTERHQKATSNTPTTIIIRAAAKSPETAGRLTIETPRAKIKTRGLPSSTSDILEAVENAPDLVVPHPPAPELPVKFRLKERALAVFRRMFHDHDSDGLGEIAWKDFTHAMTKVGFATEKLYGSVWHFTPANFESNRGIHVHEPHPDNRIRPVMARDIGRRLTNRYGWTAEDFGEA